MHRPWKKDRQITEQGPKKERRGSVQEIIPVAEEGDILARPLLYHLLDTLGSYDTCKSDVVKK